MQEADMIIIKILGRQERRLPVFWCLRPPAIILHTIEQRPKHCGILCFPEFRLLRKELCLQGKRSGAELQPHVLD